MQSWSWEDRDAIRAVLRRGTIDEIDDRGTQQMVKRGRGLKSEEFAEIYRPQAFGFTGNPPAGSEFVLASLGGRADRMLALFGEHKDHRFKNLKSGATAIYNANGQVITLIDQEIKVKANTFRVEAATIVLDGLCKLGGDDADKPAAMLGSIDSGGDAEQSNLATKVLVK